MRGDCPLGAFTRTLQVGFDVSRATKTLRRGRLSCPWWQERPGAQHSRGMTAQPLLRGEAGPVNDAKPVLLGRVGRRRALLHGYCSSLFYAAVTIHMHIYDVKEKKTVLTRSPYKKNRQLHHFAACKLKTKCFRSG